MAKAKNESVVEDSKVGKNTLWYNSCLLVNLSRVAIYGILHAAICYALLAFIDAPDT